VRKRPRKARTYLINRRRTGARAVVFGFGAGRIIDRTGSAIVGFVLAGFGLAGAVRVLLTAAASAGPTPTEGIGTAATVGYLGLLVGPPMIEESAKFIGPTGDLILAVALIAFLAVKARVAAPGNTPESAAAP